MEPNDLMDGWGFCKCLHCVQPIPNIKVNEYCHACTYGGCKDAGYCVRFGSQIERDVYRIHTLICLPSPGFPESTLHDSRHYKWTPSCACGLVSKSTNLTRTMCKRAHERHIDHMIKLALDEYNLTQKVYE